MAPPSPPKVPDTTSIQVVPGVQEVQVTLSCSLAKGGAKAAKTFLDCLPSGKDVAISSTLKDEPPLTYDGLRHFLASQNLRSQHGVGPGERIAVIMPNGPEMAVSLLLCMARAVAVPLEPSLSEEDLVAAFEQLAVAQCFLLKLHKVYDDHIRSACRTTGVRLKYLVKGPKHAGDVLFSSADDMAQCGGPSPVAPPSVVEMAPMPTQSTQPFVEGASDAGSTWTDLDVPAMLLRTSGTTAKPKVVPLTLRGMLAGSTSIAEGLGLLSTDQCLNVMPFTHIGGISCNLLGSLMAGASVRCAPAFDPARFLGWLEEFQPTWYYAVPTIHTAVRLASNGNAPRHSLRFIRNGAANLTDADARALQALFGCPVLPTYSMSECMPVAQPPKTYNLEKPGTVGLPIASSLRIVGEDGRTAAAACANGEIRGEVCISGPVVTAGYLDNPEANESSFFEDGGRSWFRTGDVGYLDSEGFLFLTGRNKELIKRAGEQVSPYEVEEVLMKHPAVQTAVVFAVPNDFWGEEVAAAVVLKAGFSEQGVASEATMQALQKATSLRKQQSWSSLNQREMALQAKQISGDTTTGAEVSSQDFMVFAARLLPEAKVPKQIKIVTEDQLPKTSTKKYQRVGLWQKLGLQAVDLSAQQALCSPIGGGAVVPPPVEVSRAVTGARCFFAFWVIVVHVGHFPKWMAVWRGLSMNMPAFFIMAGFLLEKATTRPIQNVRKFFRNRIIASHPLFLLMLVMNIGQTMLQYGVEAGLFGVPMFILGFYGYAVAGGVTWFLMIYNMCIFVFPWVHDAIDTWQVFSTSKANARTICAFSCVNSCLWLPAMAAAVVSPLIFLLVYMHAFPMWFLKFVMGMLVFKIFERNRRGFDSAGETRWGWITDLLAFGYLGMMAAMSLMVLSGMSVTDTQGFAMLVSYALPFGSPLLCIWVYGLAVGQGVVAKFFAKPFMSNTLSTATYGMFLFHMPLASLWFFVTRGVVPPAPGLDGSWDPNDPNLMAIPLTVWEFPFYVAFVIGFSWYITTYWSEKLTAWFQKVFNCSYCCCCCICSGVGILCWEPQEEETEQGTFHIVVDSISNLTGADADATSKLDEIGLDSFGAGALVGLLANRIPGLKLRAVDVYALETVGELVVFIDKGLSEKGQDSMPV